MQRFELVTDTLEKIVQTIIFRPVAKYWKIDAQKNAMKKSEEAMKRVVEMSDLLKTLIYHEYPVTDVTFVQPENPGEMHIRASCSDEQPCLSIYFSPALLGAIADNRDESSGEIEKIAHNDIQRVFYMTVDYIGAKICEEREWLDYLCEVVD